MPKNVNSGFVLFKTMFENSFVQFAGEDLGNPNKFSELLETSEPERSFKKKVHDDFTISRETELHFKKVEAMMEKLKTMDESGNRPSADKIDQLMENLVRSDRAHHLISYVTLATLPENSGEICQRGE